MYLRRRANSHDQFKHLIPTGALLYRNFVLFFYYIFCVSLCCFPLFFIVICSVNWSTKTVIILLFFNYVFFQIYFYLIIHYFLVSWLCISIIAVIKEYISINIESLRGHNQQRIKHGLTDRSWERPKKRPSGKKKNEKDVRVRRSPLVSGVLCGARQGVIFSLWLVITNCNKTDPNE